jgi:signal transduction histidine kinase
MRRSIRSSLFLLVAPFALTFTLLAWVVNSKIGPWLAQPLVANCAEKSYSEWFCNLQAGLMPWLLLGAGILILLSVTAILSLRLFRAHLAELQQDILDFQKGLRNTLAADAPGEMIPLIQLLSRILQARAGTPPEAPETNAPEPLSSDPDRPVTPHDYVQTDRRAPQPIATAPQPASDSTPETVRNKPSTPKAPPADLGVTLEELDADIEKALNEESAEPRYPLATPFAGPGYMATTDSTGKATAGDNHQASPGAGSNRNRAFPTRKCRKLIAMLGQRYPDVNFDLTTDVAESDPWTIREADLTEVFGQLLDNAGKWADSRVNIFLAIKGNMLVFGVSDDGPGVDPEVTQHMGEEGFRVNEGEPAGKGLVTVRRVLDTHGGSLSFDRSRLGGLEVIAAIPGSPLGRNFATKDAYH